MQDTAVTARSVEQANSLLVTDAAMCCNIKIYIFQSASFASFGSWGIKQAGWLSEWFIEWMIEYTIFSMD